MLRQDTGSQLSLLGLSKHSKTGCPCKCRTPADAEEPCQTQAKLNRHQEVLTFPTEISVLTMHLFPVSRCEAEFAHTTSPTHMNCSCCSYTGTSLPLSLILPHTFHCTMNRKTICKNQLQTK